MRSEPLRGVYLSTTKHDVAKKLVRQLDIDDDEC